MGSAEQQGGLRRRDFLRGTAALAATIPLRGAVGASIISLLAACGKEVEPLDKSAEVVAQIKEFAIQIEGVKTSLADLKTKINDGAKAMSQETVAEPLRKAVEGLRIQVFSVNLADNSEIIKNGLKTLKNATERRETLGHDTRFTPAEQQTLAAGWQGRINAITAATDHLERTSTRLVERKLSLQTTEDYIVELIELEQFPFGRAHSGDIKQEVRKTTESLGNDLRAASVDIDNLIKQF